MLLLDTSFWDVVWWLFEAFFLILAIWLFIALFADIFRRRDLSGFGKAGWILLLFILPFLGALIYIIARPKPTESEIQAMLAPHGGGPVMNTDDIAKAHALLQQGALTQQEYDEIKARVIG